MNYSGGFHDWNTTLSNMQPQQPQQQGGGGGMAGLGMLAMMPFLGQMGNNGQSSQPQGLGDRIGNTWQGAKDIAGKAWQGVKDVGEFSKDFSPATTFTLEGVSDLGQLAQDSVTNALGGKPDNNGDWNYKGFLRGADMAWNHDALRGWGDMARGAAGTLAPLAVGGGAYMMGKGAINAFRDTGKATALASSMRGPMGSGMLGKGLSALTGGLSRLPAATRFLNAGNSIASMGGGVLGKGLGALGMAGTTYNAFTREQDPNSSYLGNAASELLNVGGGIYSGYQTAGVPGAVAGAAGVAAGNLYRVGRDSLRAVREWGEAGEAEARAKNWEDRVKQQNAIKARIGADRWREHVQAQRAAGRKSWEESSISRAPATQPVAPVPPVAPAAAPAPKLDTPIAAKPASAPAGFVPKDGNAGQAEPKEAVAALKLGNFAVFGRC